MLIGKQEFSNQQKTYTMGILNVTPDSFSDNGSYYQSEDALRKANQLILDGVDILDIGGESTRPGYDRITDEEEIRRVIPVIQQIRAHWDGPISVDTYKSAVAREALYAGANLVNDIWGLQADEKMAEVIRECQASVCLMHNRKEAVYQEFLAEVIEDLNSSINTALDAGIDSNRIMVDPGVGFAKNYEQNMQILANLQEFHQWNLPVLLGASRKSVIGITLDLPVDEREEGTITTTVMAVLAGCQFVRVHDVKKNIRAIQMAEAIKRRQKDGLYYN